MKRKATIDAWERKLAAIDDKDTENHDRDALATKKRRLNEGSNSVIPRPNFDPQPLALRRNSVASVPPSPVVISLDETQEEILPSQVTRAPPSVLNTPRSQHNLYLPSPVSSPSEPPAIANAPDVLAADDNNAPTHLEPVAEAPPAARFLEKALVWFARPRGIRRRAPAAKWERSISRERRLHSVDSLLMGCGWALDVHDHAQDERTWVDRGVIFVDDGEGAGKEWMAFVVKTLEERRASLGGKKSLKPIWIFDSAAWTCTDGNFETRALYRMD